MFMKIKESAENYLETILVLNIFTLRYILNKKMAATPIPIPIYCNLPSSPRLRMEAAAAA